MNNTMNEGERCLVNTAKKLVIGGGGEQFNGVTNLHEHDTTEESQRSIIIRLFLLESSAFGTECNHGLVKDLHKRHISHHAC